jgi:cell division transport system permease protein
VLSRLSYVFRETWANLRRNPTLTAASLLTIVVSLTLVGVSLLIQRAVDNSLSRWQDGVEFIVFMNPEATTEQIGAVESNLKENPQVKTIKFFTKDQAYEEFKRLYPDSPELVETLTPEQMPTSFRVVPDTDDTALIDTIGQQLVKQPGVLSVEYAKKAVDWIRTVSNYLRFGSVIAAFVLLAAATMLIWNTIRTAMFARRREIEVMKLVGATNWFIRVPFMLEGLVQGLIGAGLAVAAVWAGNRFWRNSVVKGTEILEFQNLVVNSSQFSMVAIILLGLGAFIGALGSAFAVTRFLDV